MPSILQLLSLSSPQASRLFIDQIREVTSKWANWDPGNSIKVGDFGVIDKKSGELEVKGNIYDTHTSSEIFRDDEAGIRQLLDRHRVTVGAREDNFFAISMNGRQIDLNVNPNVSVPGLAQASIKGRWTFNSKRGALLIMCRPQSSYIPHNVLLEDLAKVEALKDMCLVTQVFSCSAFSLYLSNEKNDDVSLALLGSAPLPHVPGVTVGGSVGVDWWTSNAAGLFRNGLSRDGKDDYAPLYTLKKIRVKPRSRRGVPDPVYTGDDLWDDAEPPWELLDEDGNDEVTKSDSDDDDDDDD